MATIARPTLTYCHERSVRDGNSRRESFGPDECSATRHVAVKWAERYEAVKRFVGYSEIELDANDEPFRLVRLTPLVHPNVSFLYATKVTNLVGYKPLQTPPVVPVSDGVTYLDYERAWLDLMYEHVPYAVSEDNEVSAEWERFTSFGGWRPSADYLMMPGGMLMYVRAGGAAPNTFPIPFNVGKVLPIVEARVTWHRLPYSLANPTDPGPWFKRMFGTPKVAAVPPDPGNPEDPGTPEVPAQKPWIGTVNSKDLWGFAPGHILLSNVELQLRRSVVGTLEWDVTFILAFDPNKWNYKYFHETKKSSPGAELGANSGWYFVAKNATVPGGSEGAIPDDHTIYNERDHAAGLFQVRAI
jgi:hypothetical protein